MRALLVFFKRLRPRFRAHRFFHNEQGSELIEFAVSSVLLFTAIFGIMDMSRALYTYHYCAQMAREGTRYASTRGATWASLTCVLTSSYQCAATPTAVQNYILSISPNGYSSSSLTVSTTWPGINGAGNSCLGSGLLVNSPGCLVVVKVTYNFSYLFPFLPKNSLTLSSTSETTILD